MEPLKYRTLLYYCYTSIKNPDNFASVHLKFCNKLSLKGRIIVAAEGLNGTVSGLTAACEEYMAALREQPMFGGIEFKIDAVEKPSFSRMHCRHKPEIVHLGVANSIGIDPTVKTGIHLEPAEFLEFKNRDDVIILDVRSNYEHELGHFKNAIRLDLENFRDFPAKINELAQYKDKTIVTYCTGGIKCEKASALLIHEGFEDVYQLKGGIIKYGKEIGGQDFDGKCYVFDNRLAVDVNTVNPTVISRCKTCDKVSPRMINCANPKCNEHFLQCDECGDKTGGCCSQACQNHPLKRPYDGTGYYVRILHSGLAIKKSDQVNDQTSFQALKNGFA